MSSVVSDSAKRAERAHGQPFRENLKERKSYVFALFVYDKYKRELFSSAEPGSLACTSFMMPGNFFLMASSGMTRCLMCYCILVLVSCVYICIYIYTCIYIYIYILREREIERDVLIASWVNGGAVHVCGKTSGRG